MRLLDSAAWTFVVAPEASAQRGYWNPGNERSETYRERRRDDRRDYRQQRRERADRCGRTVGLERVLRRVRREFPGRLLDADMRCTRRGPVYVLKMRGADNRIRVIRVDGTDGRILSASRR